MTTTKTILQRRIAVLGASLDPPTGDGGHGGIVSYFARSSHFDEVWVLPVYIHPFVLNKQLKASFEDRVEMAKLSLEPRGINNNVRILEAERILSEQRQKNGLDPVFGTMDLFDWLLTNPPEIMHSITTGTSATTSLLTTTTTSSSYQFDFSLILGYDTLCDLLEGKWRRYEDLLKTIGIVAIERQGIVPKIPIVIPSYAKHVELVKIDQLTDVSSTRARSMTTIEELRKICDESVCQYIVRKGLYGMASSTSSSINTNNTNFIKTNQDYLKKNSL
jgi:nicotinic acid mononucleotide adenylyltransferase